MVDKQKVEKLLFEYFVCRGSVEYQSDGSVNVGGNVILSKKPPRGLIPVKFGVVDGTFRADNKGLVSLFNSPDSCNNMFVIGNKLTSLEHVPVRLDTLNVENNKLTNFVHGPEQLDTIIATDNPLTSLEGLPDSDYHISISYSEHLPLLRLVNSVHASINMPETGRTFSVRYEPVHTIINKYTGQGKPGALKAAAELIKAGYKGNARW